MNRTALIGLISAFYAGTALVRSLFGPFDALSALALGLIFVWITIVDLERLEIPDLASLLLACFGLLVASTNGQNNLVHHLLSGFAWAILFWCVGAVFHRLRGYQGLGFGDVKLIFGIGVWLGFAATAFAVFAAALSGALTVYVLGTLAREPKSHFSETAVAFGPFLCLSAWVTWLMKDLT